MHMKVFATADIALIQNVYSSVDSLHCQTSADGTSQICGLVLHLMPLEIEDFTVGKQVHFGMVLAPST